MSVHVQETVKRISVPDIAGRKGGEPIVCLTAYDAPTAALLDDHCDLLLVGDSVGMVVHGMPNTVGVTLEMMILHGQAVMRASRRATDGAGIEARVLVLGILKLYGTLPYNKRFFFVVLSIHSAGCLSIILPVQA